MHSITLCIKNGTFFCKTNRFTHLRLSISAVTGIQELGQRHSRKQADDRHNDHQLHQGEGLAGQIVALAHLLQQGKLGFDSHGCSRSIATSCLRRMVRNGNHFGGAFMPVKKKSWPSQLIAH